MGKINVYFPDDLEERYRAADKPRGWLSQVCQQALVAALDEEMPSFRTEQHGRSTRIIPPSGRSYYACVDEVVEVCETCLGEGHNDSCFECGNRGYMVVGKT